MLILPYASLREKTLVPAKLWNCLATNRVTLVRGLAIPGAVGGEVHPLSAQNAEAIKEIGRFAGLAPPRSPHVEGWNERWREIRAA